MDENEAIRERLRMELNFSRDMLTILGNGADNARVVRSLERFIDAKIASAVFEMTAEQQSASLSASQSPPEVQS